MTAKGKSGLTDVVQDPAKFEEVVEANARAKKPRRESNPQRWVRLASEAKALLEELDGMREEYAEKFDNMNEGLQASAYGQKCEAMQNLDVQSAIDLCDEAEGMDLPLGFGRD